MINGDSSEIDIKYNIDEDENIIQIFGADFVKNNKNICRMIIDDKEYEITRVFNVLKLKDYKNNKQLKIKLKAIENINNMSHMFNGCSLLISLLDVSKWKTNNVTDMSYMFNGCSLLISLPDISKWNTNNVTDMSYMFNKCSSLISLPDISNWNTNNVNSMNFMLCDCYNLIVSEKIKRKFKFNP